MATTIGSGITLNVSIDGSYVKTDQGNIGTVPIAYKNVAVSYTNGNGTYQCNAAYVSLARSLAGTGESFDLNTIADYFGTSLNFLKVKLFLIRSLAILAADTGKILTLTGDFLTQAGVGVAAGGHIVGPGGTYLLDNPIDGYPVTATTADVITVTNAVTFTYDLIILGTV